MFFTKPAFSDKCKFFLDGCQMERISSEHYLLRNAEEVLYFDKKDKPVFQSGTGETVVELTGGAIDNNVKRSWAIASFIPGGYAPLHYHNVQAEDYYIVSGCAKVIIDDQKQIITSGETIIISPGQKHQVVNESEQNELILLVKCSPAWNVDYYYLM